MQLLEQISLWARRRACYARVRRELETHTERELRDMGLSPTDIPQIARQAAALVQPEPAGAARGEDRRPGLPRQRFSSRL